MFPENSRERVLSTEEPGVGMPAPANAPYPGGYYGGDGYGSSGIGGNGYYGYDEEGYIIDGGELPEIVVYGYYYGGKDKDERMAIRRFRTRAGMGIPAIPMTPTTWSTGMLTGISTARIAVAVVHLLTL